MIMSDIAIRVENLSKQYRIGGPQARYKTIRESLTEAVGAPFRRLSSVVRGQSSAVSNETIWALKDVSFEACPELSRRVQRGEVVGIPSTGSGQALAATGRGRLRLLRQAQYKAQDPLPHHRDDSWALEVADFATAIREGEPVKSGNSADALKVMQLIKQIYTQGHR